tara:strand:+ start:1067 stop:1756 length:690 start_codon:yes stop_codon:yes gene_type:complete
MGVDRKLYGKKHVVALLLTGLIFVIGILVGLKVSEERLIFTEEDIAKKQVDYESLQMQFLYLTSQENRNCKVLLNTLERNIYDLENSRIKLENYVQSENVEDFKTVKREYMLTEIRYWMLTNEAREVCPNDKVSVLFFYEKEEDCGDCSAQGYILSYLKELFGDNLLVFSLDTGFDEPMIDVLEDNFGIMKLPAVVVNNEVYEGLTEKDEMIEIVCSFLNNRELFESCS